MKIFKLFVAMLGLMTANAFADAPTYGKLRVTYETVNIYEGASARSKIAGQGEEGDVFELRGDKLYDGFYKIQYGKKICFVMGNQVELMNPLPAATAVPKATLEPTEEPDDQGSDEPTPVPTKVPTRKPTLVPTVVPVEKSVEGQGGETTALKKLTPRPTAIPTEEAEEEPTAVPTRKPTAKPTASPTEVPTEEPTAVPTKVPPPRSTMRPTELPTNEATLAPTALPTKAPTIKPTPYPTLRPTDIPTAIPTRIPTARPTPIPTRAPVYYAPTPVPTPVSSVGHAHRRNGGSTTVVTQTRTQQRHSGGSGQILFQSSQAVASNLPPRDANLLPGIWLYMPIGIGKHLGTVEPAFKPDATVSDIRYIESSAFVGLGLEARLPAPWLRLFGDWTYFTHRTKAADQNKAAPKVGLPAPSTALFPESDVYYQMNTHAFRLGLKASLPNRFVEPWIDGTVGVYSWSAEYLDGTREFTYGADQGTAFGATAGTGIDFHFAQAHSVLTITPFLEWGAPTVNPKITNIADIGQDWKDDHGTITAPESRFGIQFAIGY
jgi:hypothetical protein